AVTNTGNAPLTFTSPGVALGPQAAQFPILVNNCITGSPLGPGGTCKLIVQFVPVGPAGPRAALLEFDSNSPDSPQTWEMHGDAVNGALATLSDTTVNFGNQGVTTTSAQKIVTLTNT